jgi:hypothetical protein
MQKISPFLWFDDQAEQPLPRPDVRMQGRRPVGRVASRSPTAAISGERIEGLLGG